MEHITGSAVKKFLSHEMINLQTEIPNLNMVVNVKFQIVFLKL